MRVDDDDDDDASELWREGGVESDGSTTWEKEKLVALHTPWQLFIRYTLGGW
jgi:hypothetical protein